MTVKKAIWFVTLITLLTSFGPPLLTQFIERASPSQLSLGEIVDLATPFLVLISLYILVDRIRTLYSSVDMDFKEEIPLAILALSAIAMVVGHGIHLSSNALSHFLTLTEHGDIYRLNHLFDEVISHYFWHAGAFGLMFGVTLLQIKYRSEENSNFFVVAGAALIYGFVLGFAFIEGETVIPMIPLTALSLLFFVVLAWRKRLSWQNRPVLMFIAIAYTLMLIGWFIYGLTFSGFPSPLELLA